MADIVIRIKDTEFPAVAAAFQSAFGDQGEGEADNDFIGRHLVAWLDETTAANRIETQATTGGKMVVEGAVAEPGLIEPGITVDPSEPTFAIVTQDQLGVEEGERGAVQFEQAVQWLMTADSWAADQARATAGLTVWRPESYSPDQKTPLDQPYVPPTPETKARLAKLYAAGAAFKAVMEAPDEPVSETPAEPVV